MQNYTSKNTSINKEKLPAIYKKINWETLNNNKSSGIVLDYGCGRYTNHIQAYVENHGFRYVGYDKYWNDNKENLECNPDLIICSNVLNVIDDEKEIKKIHSGILKYNKPYVITVYEGDGTGCGKKTKNDCYQKNQKTKYYKHNDEIVKKNVITNSKYKGVIL